MFGLIIGALSLAASIGGSIYAGSQEKKQSEEQRKQVEAQYNAKAAQAYNAGVQQIGDLQLGIAMSGVKANVTAGQAELDQVRTKDAPSLETDVVKSGIGTAIGAAKKATDGIVTDHINKKKGAPDTATMLMRQSRAALASDVRNIRETGQGVSDSIAEQSKQDTYSRIFNTTSMALDTTYKIWQQTW
jgi:hypothetical protein